MPPKKKTRKGRTVKRVNYQTRPKYKKKPKYKPNAKKDSKQKALPPGKRISKSGKVYREHRGNRSDMQKKKKPYL